MRSFPVIGSKSEVLDQDQKTNKSVTVVFIASWSSIVCRGIRLGSFVVVVTCRSNRARCENVGIIRDFLVSADADIELEQFSTTESSTADSNRRLNQVKDRQTTNLKDIAYP